MSTDFHGAPFPSRENPLVVPPGLIDQVLESDDPKLDGIRKDIEAGVIVAVEAFDAHHWVYTPGGIHLRLPNTRWTR